MIRIVKKNTSGGVEQEEKMCEGNPSNIKKGKPPQKFSKEIDWIIFHS
jgi:hypothetical protein